MTRDKPDIYMSAISERFWSDNPKVEVGGASSLGRLSIGTIILTDHRGKSSVGAGFPLD